MVLAEPTLVGREKELEELQRCLDSAAQGKGKTVFISGEAGSGKTRLITEFLNRARKHGATILTGWCLSNAAVPYFPFFEAFNAYFSGEQDAEAQGATEISEWLKGPDQALKLRKPQAFSPSVWKDQTFMAVAKTLTSISAKNPVVLFIDDMHWTDSASLSLVHYIARAISSEKVLLLATFRSEQLAADAEGRPHPLVETLRLMKREDLFREIKLCNLGQACVVELAKNMLGGNVQQDLAEKLASESQGNPLFVVESLRMLHERSGLILEHEKWRLASDKIGVPEKIKDIILQRLSLLLPNQKRMLEAASVIGERFGVELLASVLGQDCLEVAYGLDVVGQATSLVCSEGDSYRFDHAGSRAAIYDGISAMVRRGYHARVAEKLESTGKKEMLPLADLAYHYAEAQNGEKAVEYALAAGQDELARWSNVEAAHHFQYVLQKIGVSLDRFNERLAALEGLGDAYYAGDKFEQAASVFNQLADLQSGVAKLRALRKAMFAAFFLGDLPLLERFTQRAEENATADRLESGRVLHQKARILGLQGIEIPTRERLSEEAVRIFEEEYALEDAAWILFTFGSRLDPRRDFANNLRSIALYDDLGDIRSQLEAYVYASIKFSMWGLFEEAIRMCRKVIEVNDKFKMGAYIRLIPAYAILSMNLMITDVPDAIAAALKALEYAGKTDSILYMGMVYEALTRAYAYAEDMVHMEEYFEKLMSLPKDVQFNTFSRRFLGSVMGMYYAAKNDFEKANQYFNPTYLEERPANRIDYAWVLSRQGRIDEAKSQLTQAERIFEGYQKKFSQLTVEDSLMTFTHPEVGQVFDLRLDMVNVSRSLGSIVRVEGLLAPQLMVVDVSPGCLVHDGIVEFKDSTICPFGVKTAKLSVKAVEPAVFQLQPTVTYMDDLGETKTSSTRIFTINVQSAKLKFEVLPGRLPTGVPTLDALLFGGIPERHAVVLTSPSTEERDLLIKRFLKAGVVEGGISFHITAEAATAKELAQKYPSNFHLFVCNLQADTMIQNAPTIYKLKGVENLTDIDIALTKAFRNIELSTIVSKRICIDIVSDVLLQHHALTTRRWLSSLLPTLKSKGFTILAVIDSEMHPSEEVRAVLGLFDGQIDIFEKETPKGKASFLRIRKMTGQKYLKDEIPLTEE